MVFYIHFVLYRQTKESTRSGWSVWFLDPLEVSWSFHCILKIPNVC